MVASSRHRRRPSRRVAALATVLTCSALATASATTASAADGFAVRTSTSTAPVVDSAGATWSADSGFTGGTRRTLASTTAVSGTSDPALYRSYRYGMTGWSTAVPQAGDYDVTLKMVEPYWTADGRRVFDVSAEGTRVLSAVDVHAAGGRLGAVDRTVRVRVVDGRLDLAFTASQDKAVVSAVQVRAVPAAAPVAAAPATTPTETTAARTWVSGSSCAGAADGAFGTWRGRPLELVTTWADDNAAMTNFWTLQPGGEHGAWRGDLDVAVGAFGAGESWARAATGAYDARWRTSMTKLAELRRSSTGTTYVRFAHEMNGDWYPWKVDAASRADFVTSWKRFRAIQREVLPGAKLVFNVNRESVGSGVDWRTTFPGAAHVDVLGVDYYNQWPAVSTHAEWDAAVLQRDGFGAPKGLQRHLEYARSQGLPLSVSEWSGNASQGDSPVFVERMHRFFAENGGTGPGEVLYESLFNCWGTEGDFQLNPTVRLPLSAEAYRRAWSQPSTPTTSTPTTSTPTAAPPTGQCVAPGV
ncbi:malectin domain-containing carbohydrate-binding protein [uncultured Pseudokineococcus sp.]|uniref:malectin domain-containing carbohydrate-binding protein n=1 Tax=uncultured Pseudokineococcus sp. TaxID=1642928 RepID=UPI00261E16C7|nr:malectin domain-containing carbohydrate-binding protein [uncultured Pseudokineococcus sp.]